MAIFSHERHHWAYTWIPLFTAFIWFGTLVSMLITWAATGTPHYASMDGNIPYISDIGASYLKPLFVTGCCITAAGFVLCLLLERFLRNHGRLVDNFRRRERVFAWLAVLGSIIGGAGLILLSVFDTLRHPSLHRLFLLIFMVGVALSALFTIIEFRWINKDFQGGAPRLRTAYMMKGGIALTLIALAIAFGGTLYGKSTASTDAAAVLEWTIAIGYTLYLLTFWYDLRLSKGRHRGELSADRLMAQQAVPGRASLGNGNYRPSADSRATAAGAQPMHNHRY
jgi:hypothetical protein